jgi:hypothetical protein
MVREKITKALLVSINLYYPLCLHSNMSLPEKTIAQHSMRTKNLNLYSIMPLRVLTNCLCTTDEQYVLYCIEIQYQQLGLHWNWLIFQNSAIPIPNQYKTKIPFQTPHICFENFPSPKKLHESGKLWAC